MQLNLALGELGGGTQGNTISAPLNSTPSASSLIGGTTTRSGSTAGGGGGTTPARA
jgi:hypothetical protein